MNLACHVVYFALSCHRAFVCVLHSTWKSVASTHPQVLGICLSGLKSILSSLLSTLCHQGESLSLMGPKLCTILKAPFQKNNKNLNVKSDTHIIKIPPGCWKGPGKWGAGASVSLLRRETAASGWQSTWWICPLEPSRWYEIMFCHGNAWFPSVTMVCKLLKGWDMRPCPPAHIILLVFSLVPGRQGPQ